MNEKILKINVKNDIKKVFFLIKSEMNFLTDDELKEELIKLSLPAGEWSYRQERFGAL